MKLGRTAIVAWGAVILWMGLIFCFSAQPAVESGNVSMGITAVIIKFIAQLFDAANLNADWMDYVLRKTAHCVVYLALALLTVNAFRSSGVNGIKAPGAAFLVTLLYACSDEIHQLFVPGRAGMPEDVAIDALGAAFGLGAHAAAGWINRRLWRPRKIKFNLMAVSLNFLKALRLRHE